jgi:Arc/MetJ-type ribon-helix-helix transcriptional regulator
MPTDRKRLKISVALEPTLIFAVDAHVASHPGTDRSAVIDDALRLWMERNQERAMERQLREDVSRSDTEHAAWRRMRRADLRPRR